MTKEQSSALLATLNQMQTCIDSLAGHMNDYYLGSELTLLSKRITTLEMILCE